jgi:hypothetical protein
VAFDLPLHQLQSAQPVSPTIPSINTINPNPSNTLRFDMFSCSYSSFSFHHLICASLRQQGGHAPHQQDAYSEQSTIHLPRKNGGFELQPAFAAANCSKPSLTSDFSRSPNATSPPGSWQGPGGPFLKKKADAIEHPRVFDHIGLLVNGPALTCEGLPFI